MLATTQNVYLRVFGETSQQLSKENVTVNGHTFHAGEFDSSVLDHIRRSGMRVVVFLAYSRDIVQIALEAQVRIASQCVT